MKVCVLRNFTKFTEKQIYQGLFFNKVAGLRPGNFAKFLRKPILQITSGRLLLFLIKKNEKALDKLQNAEYQKVER